MLATALLVAGPTLNLWIPEQTVWIHQLKFKPCSKGCPYNVGGYIAYTSFQLQLTHLTCEDYTFQLSKQWWPEGRLKIITALTTLAPG